MEYFSAAPQPIILCGLDGEIIELNNAAQILFESGLSNLERLTFHAQSLLHIEPANKLLVPWLTRAGSVQFQTSIRRLNSAVILELEPFTEILSSVMDHELWSQILASMQIALYAVDHQERVISLHDPGHPERAPMLAAMRGQPIQRVYGEVTMELESGEQLDINAMSRRALAGEPLQGIVRSARGSFESRVVPLRDVSGLVIGYMGAAANVTEQLEALEVARRVEAQRSATLHQYADRLDAVEEAIFSYSHDLHVLDLNAAARAMIPHIGDECIGRPLLEVFPHLRGTLFERVYQQVILTRKTEQFDYHDISKARWLNMRIEPTPRGVDVHVRDISRMHHTSRALSDFFDLSAQIMCIVGLDGRLLRANPIALVVFGMPEQTLRSAELLSFVAPEDRATVRHALESLRRGASVQDRVVRITSAQGVMRHIAWSAVPYGDRIHIVGHDVTEQLFQQRLHAMNHEALEALARGVPIRKIKLSLLRRAEELLPGAELALLLLDPIEELLCTGSTEGFVWLSQLWASRRAGGWVDHVAEGALLTPVELAALPLRRDPVPYALLHTLRLSDVPESCVLCALAPHHAQLSSAHAVEVLEQLVSILSICVNRKRIERELEMLRAASAQLNDIILIAQPASPGAEPTIIFANDALERLVDRPQHALLGQPIWSFFEQDVGSCEAVRDAVLVGLPIRRQVWRPAGERVGRGPAPRQTLEIDLLPLAATPRMRDCWAMVARDITEQVRLNAELLRAQRLESVGLLTGGLAHDFNNLLTTIIGFTEFGIADATALSRAEDPMLATTASSLAMDLEEVHHAALSAGDLVRRLLAFSKHRFVQHSVFDVTASLIGMERMLRRLLPENIQLHLDLPRRACMTMGSAGELEQVVMNLAINARDAMAQGGALTLRLSSVDDGLLLTIRDTGVGIDAATLPHIFDAFFTTKEIGRGSGLGLPMVQTIIQQMKGSIEVTTAPDEGTCFIVRLPQYEAPPSMLAIEELAAESSMGECVLVVEDDASVRQLTRRLLDAAGYQTRMARSAEQAIELFEQEPDAFDLVMTDVMLSGMSGWSLAQRLRRRRPSLPILLCSGYAPTPPEGFETLGLPILSKPFQQEELLRQLRFLLDGSTVQDDEEL
jgi:PAS domain S-box-containing protein